MELLIVIVIIGILAAITIVAYNGMQQRAYAAKAEAIVDAYSKLINMYKVDHGDFPDPSDADGAGICLGTTSDYPATADFSAGACVASGGDSTNFVSSDFNAALQPYVTSLPDGSLPTVKPGDGALRGVAYNFRDDEFNTPSKLVYMVPGSIGCPRGTKSQYTYADGNTLTGCIVPLEDAPSG